jgi:cell division septum initiation protein DivIVA
MSEAEINHFLKENELLKSEVEELKERLFELEEFNTRNAP